MIARRLSAFVASITLVVSGAALTAASAGASTTPRGVTQGATWLVGQLTDGLIHNNQYDFNDYGLSIDIALALDAVGQRPDEVSAIGTAIRDHYYDFVTGQGYGSPDDLLGGQMGKALVMAEVAGTAPSSYASRVAADVEGQVAETSPIVGRIENSAPFDGNVIGQSFAARGLVVASSTKATDVLNFLLQQQCTGGGFRETFTADKTSASQSCDAAGGTPTIDATAQVLLNLEPISAQPGVAAAITAGQTWLKAQQNADGSFGDPENANSTGVAAWALGDTPESAQAASWLRDHQADDTDHCTKLSGAVGAFGYDDATLAAGRTGGITVTTQDTWRRASSQALPALQYLAPPSIPAPAVAGPAGYRRAGTSATFAVSGELPAAKLCLAGYGVVKAGAAGATGVASISATLPAGTANRTFTVTDRDGNRASTVVQVLGTKRLSVIPSSVRVRARHLVRVVVRGYAAGERTGLRLRGILVRTGTASATGTWAVTINVGATLGRATVRATGQFPAIRRGAAVVTVIR